MWKEDQGEARAPLQELRMYFLQEENGGRNGEIRSPKKGSQQRAVWAHTGKCCQASVEERKNSEPSEITGTVITIETLVYNQISPHETVKSKFTEIQKEKVV